MFVICTLINIFKYFESFSVSISYVITIKKVQLLKPNTISCQ